MTQHDFVVLHNTRRQWWLMNHFTTFSQGRCLLHNGLRRVFVNLRVMPGVLEGKCWIRSIIPVLFPDVQDKSSGEEMTSQNNWTMVTKFGRHNHLNHPHLGPILFGIDNGAKRSKVQLSSKIYLTAYSFTALPTWSDNMLLTMRPGSYQTSSLFKSFTHPFTY